MDVKLMMMMMMMMMMIIMMMMMMMMMMMNWSCSTVEYEPGVWNLSNTDLTREFLVLLVP